MLVATITDRLYRWVGAVGLAALRAVPTSRQLSALNGERKALNWRSIESRSIVACGSVAGDSRHVVVVVSGAGGPVGWPTPLESRC